MASLSVHNLLDTLATHGAQLPLSEEERTEVGFTLVKAIVSNLALFLRPYENDASERSLMQVVDEKQVLMGRDMVETPCTGYMQALDYYVHKKDGYISGSLVFALNPRDGLTKQLKTDYKKKVCNALTKLLQTNRGQIHAWTTALKQGFVMPALGYKRKSFSIVSDKVEAVWRLIEEFDALWK